MTSVWKRLQRVGKKASKFQYAATYQELLVECTHKWQPDKLRVVWIRRNRRHSTKLHSWHPGIQNPYRGTVVWQVPESVDIPITLFKDPTAEEFEDKDWTVIVEDETKGRRKVLASADVNMKKYASATQAKYDMVLKLKPMSVKIVEATLKLTLSCIFLKEGKATDEDMQSLASLLSLKQSDIGNLDDFSDEEAGDDRRATFGSGLAHPVTEYKRQLCTLLEEDNGSSVPTGVNRVSSQKLDPSRSQERKRGAPLGVEAVRRSAGPESLLFLLPSNPCSASGLQYVEMPKAERVQTELNPATEAGLKAQEPGPFLTAPLTPGPAGPEPSPVPSVGESSDRNKSHMTKMTIQLGSLNAKSKPVKPKSAANTKPLGLPVQTTLLPIGQPFETVPKQKQKIAVEQTPDVLVDPMGDYTVTMDLGEKRTAASLLSFPKELSSDSTSTAMSKTLEASKYNVVTETLSNDPQTQCPEIPGAAQKGKPRTKKKNKNAKDIAAMAAPATLKKASDVGAPTHEEEADAHLASCSTRIVNMPVLTQKYFKEGTERIHLFMDTKPHDVRLDVRGKQANPNIVLENKCGDTFTEVMPSSAPREDASLGFSVTSKQKHDRVREPCVVDLLPSCPQRSVIPGISSLERHLVVDWPTNGISPLEKLPSKRMVSCAHSNYKHLLCDDNMVSMISSCPKSPGIPGFPTVPKHEPNMVNILPSCPRVTSVPGLASTPLDSCYKESIMDRSVLWSKKVQIKEQFTVHMSSRPDTYTENLKDMVLMLPACPRTALIPGFPSSPRQEASFAKLLPTCPKVARALGMPSQICIKGADKYWHKDTPLLWYGTFKNREGLFSHIDLNHNVASVHSKMVAIRPSCPVKSSLPGFPLAPKRIAPSIVSNFFTCPMASRIAGVSTRKPLNSDSSTTWLVLKTNVLCRPSSNERCHVVDEISKISTDFLNNENMLPSCPSRKTINGFPFAPRKAPSMVNLLPTCPKVVKVLGLASITCIKSGENVWDFGNSLWRKPLAKEGTLMGRCQEIICSNHSTMKAMVDMMPSCPQKARIHGFPSTPRQEISIVSMRSTCPRKSRVPGFPSKEPYSSYGKDVETCKQLVLGQPLRKSELLIKGDLIRHFHCPDKGKWCSSVIMLPSCPSKSLISGVPSAPRKSTHSMLNLVDTCPRQTHVCGLPSGSCNHSESKGWCSQNKQIIKNRPAQKRCTEILRCDLRDAKSTESMAATLPSCPEITSVPGFASVWRQTSARNLNMQNMEPTCAKMSRVSGMPSLNHSIAAYWSIDKQSHLSPKLRSVLHFEKMYSLDSDMVTNMVSMLASCPREAHLPGFPSNSSSVLADLPSMLHLQHICPKHSRCSGIPTRYPSDLDEDIWNEDKGLIWERPAGNRKSKKVVYGERISQSEKYMVKIMVSMLPPCAKTSSIPGFPSKFPQSKHTSVNNEPTFPKRSEIPGLPAINHTANQDDWRVHRNTIWQKGLGMSQGLQLSWTMKELPSSDRERMLRILPLCARCALSPGFPSAELLFVERSISPNQDGDKVTGQRMSGEASFCSKGSVVTDLTPAHSEHSGDKYLNGTKEDMLLQPDAIQYSFNEKEVEFQSGSASGSHKMEKGFWTQNETEDVGTRVELSEANR